MKENVSLEKQLRRNNEDVEHTNIQVSREENTPYPATHILMYPTDGVIFKISLETIVKSIYIQ
jgi:hypothetical protein